MRSLDILVVDDEDSIRRLLQDVLTHFGHQVVTCQDGGSAIEVAAERDFDLVFLDIRMPGMSGVEVLKKLREVRPDSIFVMITGYARDDIVEDCLRSGASDCLGKPFSLAQVKKLLDEIGSRIAVAAE